MFLRWGRFVYRHRRLVATIAVLSALASLTLAARVSSALTTGGWYDPSSESQQVARTLAQDFAGK